MRPLWKKVYESIAHGDDAHKKWLSDKCEELSNSEAALTAPPDGKFREGDLVDVLGRPGIVTSTGTGKDFGLKVTFQRAGEDKPAYTASFLLDGRFSTYYPVPVVRFVSRGFRYAVLSEGRIEVFSEAPDAEKITVERGGTMYDLTPYKRKL